MTKEADVINKKEVQATSDIVFVIDKSTSMDSHINDTMKNVETFVRNLSAKNIQARLGLVAFERSDRIQYFDFNGSKFTTDPESFISALKTIKTYGGYENTTVPLRHIATQRTTTGHRNKQSSICIRHYRRANRYEYSI